MKNVFVALSVVTLLAACGSKSNNNGPAQDPNVYAAVDMPAECGGPIRQAIPSDYQNAGCSPYNWDNGGHFRHGGCPRHTFAACAAGVGMICIPQDIASNYNVAWFNYHDGSRRLSFCGYEGARNQANCAYRSIPGAGNIGRACVVGGANECGYGRCQPINNDRGDVRGDYRGNRRGARLAVGVCVQ